MTLRHKQMRPVPVKHIAEIQLTHADDAAITEFRAFHVVASVHTKRVENPIAVEIMRQILDGLQRDLDKKVEKKAA